MAEARIVYQDEFLMVVSKPAAWVTTRENSKFQISNFKTKYVEDWVKRWYPNDLPREGIVNRLDLGTSGLLLVAKRSDVLERLRQEQKERRIKKKYWALVDGNVPLEGEVRMPIGRCRFNFRRWQVREDGKEAVTRFKKLRLYNKDNVCFSLVEVELLTGRTHQIRVHFSYLRWPVSGDVLYGSDNRLKLERQFLHSKYLGFYHPVGGKWLEFEDELANDLALVLEQI